MGGDAARHPLLSAVVRWLSARRLNGPAIVLLEIHRPLAFAAGQGALFFQPLLSPWFGDDAVQRFACWLCDENGLDQCIAALQEER